MINFCNMLSLLKKIIFTLPMILPFQASGAQFTEIPLWPDGAPGSEGINVEEEVIYRTAGIVDRAIHNVTEPTLRIYLPPKIKRQERQLLSVPVAGTGI